MLGVQKLCVIAVLDFLPDLMAVQDSHSGFQDFVGTAARARATLLEKLQAGGASRAFDGGRISPYHERAVHRFQRTIAERVSS